MIKSSELLTLSGIGGEGTNMTGRAPSQCDENKEIQKFTMIFNKYANKLKPKDENKFNGPKYTMIFNKDVTVRTKLEPKKIEEIGKADGPLKSELKSMKLNDAETLMNLYGRSNLFIPELTITNLLSGNDDNNNKKNASETGSRLNNCSTSLSRKKVNRNILKNKIASLTSLEMHLARDASRKHSPTMQERKLFRVRSLDLSESRDFEKFQFQKSGTGERGKSDKKSRGDGRKGDKDNGYRKQVQWKSEVDVIYFECKEATEGDRSGEIFGRVVEPLKEEWEQQRTGFYAKMVPPPFASHLNERWQSLLKI